MATGWLISAEGRVWLWKNVNLNFLPDWHELKPLDENDHTIQSVIDVLQNMTTPTGRKAITDEKN